MRTRPPSTRRSSRRINKSVRPMEKSLLSGKLSFCCLAHSLQMQTPCHAGCRLFDLFVPFDVWGGGMQTYQSIVCRELARGGNADAIRSVIHTYYDNWAEERAIVTSGPAGAPLLCTSASHMVVWWSSNIFRLSVATSLLSPCA